MSEKKPVTKKEQMMKYLPRGRTLVGPPRLESSGFLRFEVSTKNTMARFPPFFDLSSGEIDITSRGLLMDFGEANCYR